jgi:hypothetical protein
MPLKTDIRLPELTAQPYMRPEHTVPECTHRLLRSWTALDGSGRLGVGFICANFYCFLDTLGAADGGHFFQKETK